MQHLQISILSVEKTTLNCSICWAEFHEMAAEHYVDFDKEITILVHSPEYNSVVWTDNKHNTGGGLREREAERVGGREREGEREREREKE